MVGQTMHLNPTPNPNPNPNLLTLALSLTVTLTLTLIEGGYGRRNYGSASRDGSIEN